MNKKYRLLGIVLVSLFLGISALLVSFVAGSAFETKGTTSIREVSAACVALALYLAFCQFWVAPRGSSEFRAKLPTLVASIAPLLVFVAYLMQAVTWSQGTSWLWTQGIPWLASGCFGSVIGAMIAARVTATPQRGTLTAGSMNRGSSSRNYLLVGFILLVAVALLIPAGVIPSVVATPPGPTGFNARGAGVFLWITVVFDLLAAAILAFALWRSRKNDHFSKGALGVPAFLALLLAFVYALSGLAGGHGPAVRTASVLLVLCAVFALITTALVTATSVIVDRARLCA